MAIRFVKPFLKVTHFGVVTTMSWEPILVNGDDITNIENEDPMQIMINDAFGLFGTCTNEESFT